MKHFSIDEKALIYQEYLNRESNNPHDTHEEDMVQYNLIREGDPRAVEEARRIMDSGLPGHLSDDPLRNIKYLVVAASALASRSSIAGGMEAERAYNISDLFIQKMDLLKTVEEVKTLHLEMVDFYIREMARMHIRKKPRYSKPVMLCMRCIDKHLHERITIDMLSQEVGLNSSYLSILFKKETGASFTQYILQKKIGTACNMLIYSKYSLSEISSILAFSSQSHFARAFKSEIRMTPNEYRRTQSKHE